MNDKIKEIAELRQGIEFMKEDYDNAVAELEELEIVKAVNAQLAKIGSKKEVLAGLEADYKAECETEYATTLDKDQLGGKINITNTLSYTEEKAVAWLIEKKFASALKPINKEFKALAKAAKPKFVTFSTVPKMKLDSDLSEFLS